MLDNHSCQLLRCPIGRASETLLLKWHYTNSWSQLQITITLLHRINIAWHLLPLQSWNELLSKKCLTCTTCPTLVAQIDCSSGWNTLKQNPSFFDGRSRISQALRRIVPTQWLDWNGQQNPSNSHNTACGSTSILRKNWLKRILYRVVLITRALITERQVFINIYTNI